MECRDIHTGFPRLYIAANGRCLIKAFTISLACSVVPFCKQKRWENVSALGHLVLKKLFSLTITHPAWKGAEPLCTHSKVPCSKPYFSFHFIWGGITYLFIEHLFRIIKLLNWISYFYSMKITVFLILGILLIQHTWQCYSPTQNANATF